MKSATPKREKAEKTVIIKTPLTNAIAVLESLADRIQQGRADVTIPPRISWPTDLYTKALIERYKNGYFAVFNCLAKSKTLTRVFFEYLPEMKLQQTLDFTRLNFLQWTQNNPALTIGFDSRLSLTRLSEYNEIKVSALFTGSFRVEYPQVTSAKEPDEFALTELFSRWYRQREVARGITELEALLGNISDQTTLTVRLPMLDVDDYELVGSPTDRLQTLYDTVLERIGAASDLPLETLKIEYYDPLALPALEALYTYTESVLAPYSYGHRQPRTETKVLPVLEKLKTNANRKTLRFNPDVWETILEHHATLRLVIDASLTVGNEKTLLDCFSIPDFLGRIELNGVANISDAITQRNQDALMYLALGDISAKTQALMHGSDVVQDSHQIPLGDFGETPQFLEEYQKANAELFTALAQQAGLQGITVVAPESGKNRGYDTLPFEILLCNKPGLRLNVPSVLVPSLVAVCDEHQFVGELEVSTAEPTKEESQAINALSLKATLRRQDKKTLVLTHLQQHGAYAASIIKSLARWKETRVIKLKACEFDTETFSELLTFIQNNPKLVQFHAEDTSFDDDQLKKLCDSLKKTSSHLSHFSLRFTEEMLSDEVRESVIARIKKEYIFYNEEFTDELSLSKYANSDERTANSLALHSTLNQMRANHLGGLIKALDTLAVVDLSCGDDKNAHAAQRIGEHFLTLLSNAKRAKGLVRLTLKGYVLDDIQSAKHDASEAANIPGLGWVDFSIYDEDPRKDASEYNKLPKMHNKCQKELANKKKLAEARKAYNEFYSLVDTEKIQELIAAFKKGLSRYYINDEGYSLLHLAVRLKKSSVVAYLLSQNFNREMIDNEGETAEALANSLLQNAAEPDREVLIEIVHMFSLATGDIPHPLQSRTVSKTPVTLTKKERERAVAAKGSRNILSYTSRSPATPSGRSTPPVAMSSASSTSTATELADVTMGSSPVISQKRPGTPPPMQPPPKRQRMLVPPKEPMPVMFPVSTLFSNAAAGDTSFFKQLVDSSDEIWDSRDAQQKTFLHVAALNGHAELTRYLLSHIPVDALDAENNTPLLSALRTADKMDYVDVAQYLLAKGANVQHINQRGEDALFILAGAYSSGVHANINNYQSAYLRLVKCILLSPDFSPHPYQLPAFGTGVFTTALHMAVKRGFYPLVKVIQHHRLIDGRAQDSRGNTPLHVALENPVKHRAILALLLSDPEIKVILSLKNSVGNTPAQVLDPRQDQALMNELQDAAKKIPPSDQPGVIWAKKMTFFWGSQSPQKALPVDLDAVHYNLKAEVDKKSGGGMRLSAALTFVLSDLGSKQRKAITVHLSHGESAHVSDFFEYERSASTGGLLALKNRQIERVRHMSAMETTDEHEQYTVALSEKGIIASFDSDHSDPSFPQLFHHAEQALLAKLMETDTQAFLIKQLKEKLQNTASEDVKVLGVIVSVHSPNYVCSNCELALIAESLHCPDGFIAGLSAQLQKAGFHLPFMQQLRVTVTAGSTNSCRKGKKEATDHLDYQMDLRCMPGILVQQDLASTSEPLTSFRSRRT